MSLMASDNKILNKIPENGIQMCIKRIIYHDQVDFIPAFKLDVAYENQSMYQKTVIELRIKPIYHWAKCRQPFDIIHTLSW